MIFPIMISIMVEVLQTIPYDLKAASLSLGATKWDTIKHVILKKARPGIVAAIVLSTSRAFGETIAVLMVCGNVAKVPTSIFDAGYPIPALIANNFGEMMSIPLYESALMFSALLLFVIIFIFNLSSRLILRRLEGGQHGSYQKPVTERKSSESFYASFGYNGNSFAVFYSRHDIV